MKIIIAKDVLEQAEKYYKEQTTKKKLTNHESYVKYKKSHLKYRENNKERIKENNKKYLEFNKEYLANYQKEYLANYQKEYKKIFSGYCSCCKANYKYIAQHRKTKKHINNLN